MLAHTACGAAALDAAADRGVGGAALTCRLPVPCSCAGVLLPSSRCQGPDSLTDALACGSLAAASGRPSAPSVQRYSQWRAARCLRTLTTMDESRWAIPVIAAMVALRLRLLQPAASIGGLLVGLAVIYSPHQPEHAAMLLVFFVAGSGSTKLTARLRKQQAPQAAAPLPHGTSRAAGASPGTQARRRRRGPTRSPSASPAVATVGIIKVASDESDARRGRTLQQVMAVGLVPALLCIFRERVHASWQLCYLCYLAACAGDTLASEFGSLTARPPLLVTTLRPVPAGTDGGISLVGTLASLCGGAMVGACAGDIVGLMQGLVAGGTGSLLDSLLGAALQHPQRMAGQPGMWKTLNCLVNLLSATAVAAAAPFAVEQANLVAPVLALLLLLVCAATAGLSATAARKVLHIGTSLLVVHTDRTAPAHLPGANSIRVLMIGLSAAATAGGALSWCRRWDSSPLLFFEKKASQPAPGIALYAAAVLVVVLARLPIDASLGPLFFGDPAAALCGQALRHCRGKGIGNGKTLSGSLAFVAVTAAWFAVWCGDELLVSMLKGGVLAAVEYASGSWDNIALPFATVTLNYFVAAARVW